MDAIVKKLNTTPPELGRGPDIQRPSEEQAMAAVRTLIAWAGDDPGREGLVDTPKRVIKAYQELFNGYRQCPVEALSRTFDDVGGYDDLIMLRDIDFSSHCEHHMVPFVGRAHIAYLPGERVVGISKLARVVEIFARRLQTQEALTAQIACAINETLAPRGVAVLVEATHQCMTMRGVNKRNATTITTQFSGEFKTEPVMQARFMELVRSPSSGPSF